ncbi:ABC transporter substrate-binding protein [Rhodobacteraceae bacterium N5(2021)]|uniref:ABC transporter substrate-binding protein n=1 Tax=Gymnodinialimonas phycosphaerae TaxID=2841589 RepID=A0A975TXF0_9RHOB|nr:ABC transporter substrate-binding protein [Gymnodinialimonas phycosphaerae]MBY4892314.1 ABC transporter substrate-binding protein [Gymnodinialimonas phycosphaerae]
MKDFTHTRKEAGLKTHPVAEMYAAEHKAGKLDRREFLVRSTALGLTATAAYSLIGTTPAMAEGHRAVPGEGGSLRIQMEVRALKDPRTYDWSQMGNVTRGIVEYLVQYNNDGSFEGVLLDSWEANEDATVYTLNVRQGITFNNGDPFNAEDVAANLIGFCDSTVEGNSMATRMGGLVDPDTGVARDGAIEVVDEYTVRVTYPSPDITFIPGIADYPSAIQHRDMVGTNPADHGIGTGAYMITNYEVGVSATLTRNPDHTYWRDTYLDEIVFVDLGQDPAAWFAAAEADEFDMTYETVGEFIDLFDAIGWNKGEVVTAATVVIRPNQNNAPYDDVRVRRAIQLAVDNQVCLDLGVNGQGVVAENHHVCPIHPEYAELPPLVFDPEAARALLEEAGHADTEFELVSIDDDYRKNTTDAVAAQLRDAGFNVTRTIIPGSTFWNDWTSYPFSSTNWNHRELGVMILNLAYRTGVPWNETAFSNEEFDTLLTEANGIQDADARRVVMERLEQIMQEEGVTIQPYWRSLFNHARPGVVNGSMHAKFEMNPHYLGFEA